MRSRGIVTSTIVILNVLVFLLWTFHTDTEANAQFMIDNFLCSWESLVDGRWWSALGSAFSHNMFLHLFINMLVLLNFGGVMEKVLGARRYLGFYLVAGIVGSVSHSALSAFLLHEPDLPALGASGAISGIILLFSLLFPKEKLLLLGIIPLPALFGALVFIGLDIWGLTAQVGGGGLPIGHGAHLGGAFTGIIYYFILRRRLKKS